MYVCVYTHRLTHTLIRSDEQIHKHTGTHEYVCMLHHSTLQCLHLTVVVLLKRLF